MIDKLKQIVQDFQEIKKETKLKELSDDMLFDCAVRVFNSSNINNSKSNNFTKPGPAPTNNIDNKALATENQISYLKRLKVKIPDGLTKLEAIGLIDQAVKDSKNKKNADQDEDGQDDY